MASAPEEPRYRIEFTHPALQEFRELPRKIRTRIASRIDALAENPRPRGAEKLKGADDHYRIRIGNHRVIYTIVDARLIITVVRIADCSDAYRP